jgi:phosphatidylglycerophosphatase A
MAATLGEPKMDPAVARARLAAMKPFPRFSLTVGGLGFARFAPGTWGSVPPCVLVLVLVATLPHGLGWVIDAALGVLLVWSSWGCERWGAQAEELLGVKDPSCVVLDEVAGMSLSMLLLHWHLRSDATDWSWAWKGILGVALAFVLFRAFDVIKPPPCRALQNIRGGRGILLDDLFAGVYASVILHVVGPLAG